MEFLRKKHRFSYLHPLVKDLSKVEEDNHLCPPPLYSVYKSPNPSIPSSKILRTTHKWTMTDRTNYIVLQPFHPGVEFQQTNHLIRCPQCHTIMNPKTQILSTCQYKCNVCSQISHHDSSLCQPLVKNAVIDIVSEFSSENTIKKASIKKHVLFVLELNEFSYNFKTHEVIRSIVAAYKQSSMHEFGFILFSRTHIFLFDIENRTLHKLYHSSNDIPQLPTPPQNLFKQASNTCLQESLDQLCEIVYEAFLEKVQTLENVCHFIQRNFREVPNLHCKFLINTVKEKEGMNNNKQNEKIHCYRDSPFDFFVINQNASYQRIMSSFISRQVHKIYNRKNYDSDELYYDLYSNIEMESYNNLKMEVRSSKMIKPEIKQIKFKQIKSCTPLLMEYTVNKEIQKSEKETQFIQFEFHITPTRRRVISYSIPGIYNSLGFNLKRELTLINPETYFYVMIRKIMLTTPGKKVREQFIKRMKALAIASSDRQNLEIEKSIVPLFLSAFQILSQNFMIQTSQLSVYEKHRFFRKNLQTLEKSIYPRTYEVEPQLKNIKSIRSKLESDKMYLIDNGSTLFLVICQNCSVQTLKKNFGEWEVNKICQIRQLPVLESNQSLRQSIELVRWRDEVSFLPLKIITDSGFQFQNQVAPYLYVSEDHRTFLYSLWSSKK